MRHVLAYNAKNAATPTEYMFICVGLLYAAYNANVSNQTLSDADFFQ